MCVSLFSSWVWRNPKHRCVSMRRITTRGNQVLYFKIGVVTRLIHPTVLYSYLITHNFQPRRTISRLRHTGRDCRYPGYMDVTLL